MVTSRFVISLSLEGKKLQQFLWAFSGKYSVADIMQPLFVIPLECQMSHAVHGPKRGRVNADFCFRAKDPAQEASCPNLCLQEEYLHDLLC